LQSPHDRRSRIRHSHLDGQGQLPDRCTGRSRTAESRRSGHGSALKQRSLVEPCGPQPEWDPPPVVLLRRKGRQLMAVPIVCFVRRSTSGTRALIERMIRELVRAGYKAATVKHAGHGFDLDTEGKDSWRHKQAGASSVVVISKGSMAMFADVSD